MQVRFIEVDGIPTRCLYAGDENAYPILLMHGHDLIAEVWLKNIDELAKRLFCARTGFAGQRLHRPGRSR